MSTVRLDLRSLRWWVATAVVILTLIVLVIRIVGLVVIVVVDLAERVEITVACAAGITPLGTSTFALPYDASGVRL